jgi:hypothetical protein
VKDVRVGKTYMYLVEQWLQDGNNNGGKQAISTLAVTLNQRKYIEKLFSI